MYYGLSDEQRRVVLHTLRTQGTMSLAAHNAGITPATLRATIQKDDLLAEEVSDALELFKDAIRLTVLERATTGRSDAMLKLAAEAFVPESFKAQPQAAARQRPTVLTVRSFDESSSPNDDTDTPSNTESPSRATTTPTRITTTVVVRDFDESTEPPRIDYHRGL